MLGKLRKLGVFVALISGFLLPGGTARAEPSSFWQPTLDSAQRLAAHTQRLVLVYFHADWCRACVSMDQQVFGHPEAAGRILAGFVPVRINVDHFPATARQYGVTALPTTVVISPQGALLGAIAGHAEPTAYLAQLDQVAAQAARRSSSANGHPSPAANPRAPADMAVPFDHRRAPAGAQDRALWSEPRSAMASPSPMASPAGPPTPRGYSPGPAGSNAGTPDAPQLGAGPSAARPQLGLPQTVGPESSGPQPGAPRSVGPQPFGPQSFASQSARPQSGRPEGAGPSGSPTAGATRWGSATPGPSAPAAPDTRAPAGAGTGARAPVAPGGGASQAQVIPAGHPPLGLDGCCPVTLVEQQKWVVGDRPWGAFHRGRTYLFVGPDQQRRFLADPDRYAPVLSGYDVVAALAGRHVPGLREHGLFFDGHVYLFADEASLEEFSSRPEHYADPAWQAMGKTRPQGSPSVEESSKGWFHWVFKWPPVPPPPPTRSR